MKEIFVNSLIEASENVLKSIVSPNINLGNPYIVAPSLDDNSIEVCVGFTGEFRGQAFFVMNKEIACHIATQMIMMPIEDINEISRSAINELCNMIMGNVGSLLFDSGIEINITTPSFILGENLKYVINKKTQVVHIPFDIDQDYKINIEILI